MAFKMNGHALPGIKQDKNKAAKAGVKVSPGVQKSSKAKTAAGKVKRAQHAADKPKFTKRDVSEGFKETRSHRHHEASSPAKYKDEMGDVVKSKSKVGKRRTVHKDWDAEGNMEKSVNVYDRHRDIKKSKVVTKGQGHRNVKKGKDQSAYVTQNYPDIEKSRSRKKY